MARQWGDIKITGTVHGISFYKTMDGYLARMKTGVPGAVVKKDPRFTGTRQMNSEFGRAGASSKILRRALLPLLGVRTGRALNNRLTRQFLAVIHGDKTHGRGLRQVLDGDLKALLGFEFRQERPLSGVWSAPFKTVFNRAAGRFSVQIPVIKPGLELNLPQNATHARFVLTGLSLHAAQTAAGFEIKANTRHSTFLAIDDVYTTSLTLNGSADFAAPLAVVLGVEFWCNTGPLADSNCYAAAVVAVNAGQAVNVPSRFERKADSRLYQKPRYFASRNPVRPVVVKSTYRPYHSPVLRL